MGSVPRWTKAIHGGPDINPGRLGRFPNIFNNYAGWLGLQCNIKCYDCHSGSLHDGKYLPIDQAYSQGSVCQPRSPWPVLEYFQ